MIMRVLCNIENILIAHLHLSSYQRRKSIISIRIIKKSILVDFNGLNLYALTAMQFLCWYNAKIFWALSVDLLLTIVKIWKNLVSTVVDHRHFYQNFDDDDNLTSLKSLSFNCKNTKAGTFLVKISCTLYWSNTNVFTDKLLVHLPITYHFK